MKQKCNVLIAGVGGASLGTELLKCLLLDERYKVYGCDISPLAYGHYQKGFKKTFVVKRDTYIDDVLDVCRKGKITAVVPGGEEPMALLRMASERFANMGVQLAINSPEVIDWFADKKTTFEILAQHGFAVPKTVEASKTEDLVGMTYPCVIKPATGSGGSSFVFLADNEGEAALYVAYLQNNGLRAVVQEYISEKEGEFSLGVLSLPGHGVVGSIAMKRIFESKLAIHSKTRFGLISSPYGQGLIDKFGKIRDAAETIADAVNSKGPLNIQARVRDGQLIPFEINPRFSGSEFLRAMAGFNQPDIMLTYLTTGEVKRPSRLRYGYYLRSLSETYIPTKEVIR